MALREGYRITTFVPPEHRESVLEAVIAQTPLAFGPYDKSAWWTGPGTEQFEPRPGAKPTTGKIGQVERVPTVRLEFAIPRKPELLDRVIDALCGAHPWEEPAVFVDQVMVTATRF